MNNEKVIKEFLSGNQAKTQKRTILNGYYTYEGRTLYTNGNILVNYSTNIARLEGEKLYLNIKKYSVTTSKIQSMIKRLASQKGLEVVEVEGEV